MKLKFDWIYDALGNKVEVKLKYRDFKRMLDWLEDLEDSYTIYKETSKPLKTVSLDKVMKEISSNGIRK